MTPAKPLLVFVVGTRPEAIKMAPVVVEFRRFGEVAETLLVSTGQHREILAQALDTFGLAPDIDLAIMTHGQSLAQVTARAIEGLDAIFADRNPAMVFAQGDTTTTFVSALGAFYRQIPFAHVEAGLRTDRIDNPFPEEFNRRAAGLVAGLHFPPTQWSRDNLLREGKDDSTICVTGNTGIDAVIETARRTTKEWYPGDPHRIVLLTTHRRENWGDPQRAIALAARQIIDRFADTKLVVAMHPNPNVRAVLRSVLEEHPRIDLIEPPQYSDFVKLLQRASLILTDSGGVQEEAPSFGVPVLVLRETTERPEGVAAGTAKLVGTDFNRIVQEASQLLSDPNEYSKMAQSSSPYGDGFASARIRHRTFQFFDIDSPEVRSWA